MGDSKRFKLFAQLIAREFPASKYPVVGDIAGGDGSLNVELSKLGYQVVTFDSKRRKNGEMVTFKRKLFTQKTEGKFDLLVGMHPDGATDVIIYQASLRGIPFTIAPCCAIPAMTCVEWKKKNSKGTADWYRHCVDYANRLGFKTVERQLNMDGKNKVLIGKL